MSRSLPHLTLTTRTSSLSPITSTSPIFPTVSPPHTRAVVFDPYLPCDVPRQSGGSTQIPSLTGSAKPVFRDAHDRRHFSPKPKFRFDKSVPSRLLERTRLSILSWNPGPRRGRDGAIEEHISGKWHVIALQGAIEYLQHECLTNHFDITHDVGCAVLFNKVTFH